MQRTFIQIARIRLSDVRAGDVINGHPDHEQGWFRVATVREIQSGALVAAGDTNAQSVKGAACDLVGLQVTKQVDVPTTPTAAAPAGPVPRAPGERPPAEPTPAGAPS